MDHIKSSKEFGIVISSTCGSSLWLVLGIDVFVVSIDVRLAVSDWFNPSRSVRSSSSLSSIPSDLICSFVGNNDGWSDVTIVSAISSNEDVFVLLFGVKNRGKVNIFVQHPYNIGNIFYIGFSPYLSILLYPTPSCHFFVWIRSCPDLANRASQTVQTKRFSPVCVLIWFLQELGVLNRFGQKSHLNGRSPVWTRMCAIILCLKVILYTVDDNSTLR